MDHALNVAGSSSVSAQNSAQVCFRSQHVVASPHGPLQVAFSQNKKSTVASVPSESVNVVVAVSLSTYPSADGQAEDSPARQDCRLLDSQHVFLSTPK